MMFNANDAVFLQDIVQGISVKLEKVSVAYCNKYSCKIAFNLHIFGCVLINCHKMI